MMKMATELYLEMPHQLLDQIELFSRRRNKQPIFYPLCQYTCRLGTRGWGLSPLQNPRPRAGYLWKVNADVWKSKCKNDIRLTDDIKRPLLLKVHSSVLKKKKCSEITLRGEGFWYEYHGMCVRLINMKCAGVLRNLQNQSLFFVV